MLKVFGSVNTWRYSSDSKGGVLGRVRGWFLLNSRK
jgi:hypothetical protein